MYLLHHAWWNREHPLERLRSAPLAAAHPERSADELSGIEGLQKAEVKKRKHSLLARVGDQKALSRPRLIHQALKILLQAHV